VVPLTLVNRIYNKHVIRYQKELHDRFESLYDVFETKDIEFIRSYFQSTAKAHQKIANWGAVNFSAMRLVLLGVFLMVLHISIDLNEYYWRYLRYCGIPVDFCGLVRVSARLARKLDIN
jgi:hypothetical protein